MWTIQAFITPHTHKALYLNAAQVNASFKATPPRDYGPRANDFIGAVSATPTTDSSVEEHERDLVGRIRALATALRIATISNPIAGFRASDATLSEALDDFDAERRSTNVIDRRWSVALTLLNNIQSIVFMLLFWELRGKIRTPPGLTPSMVGVVSVVVFTVLHFGCVSLFPNYAKYFAWSSGISAGIAMALFLGRLQSNVISPPIWTLIALYGYALLQPAWGVFADDGRFMTIIAGIALFLKALLYMFVWWLINTGLLLAFYEISHAQDSRDDLDMRRRTIVRNYLASKPA